MQKTLSTSSQTDLQALGAKDNGDPNKLQHLIQFDPLDDDQFKKIEAEDLSGVLAPSFEISIHHLVKNIGGICSKKYIRRSTSSLPVVRTLLVHIFSHFLMFLLLLSACCLLS